MYDIEKLTTIAAVFNETFVSEGGKNKRQFQFREKKISLLTVDAIETGYPVQFTVEIE